MGFDSRRVVRPVLGEGLESEDKVILLQPSSGSSRGEDAFEEVKQILTQVVPDFDLTTEHLPHTDFVESVLYCADLIQAAKGDTVVILGGGARELLFPLTVATFSTENYIDTILQVGDIDSSVRRLPKLNLQGSTTGAEKELLMDLIELNTPLSITDIADELAKSKSTIARHVNSLEQNSFVQTQAKGRTKTVVVTDSGRVFLETR
ncbi:CRISPR-associated DNA-binding Csa3 [Natrialba hulunbeirensis JCM 10989]|uniref:CRISPR-associated DNA-binding Csa3 n=1 Tax=Natrialba hulunbeirensis JCM 10989 TaxID=1227493 RepID=M0ACP5_9EURY|nr:CRISPR-associated DNA-binding Csa3 [Natrialba hulunbeirensis JCM 10989]